MAVAEPYAYTATGILGDKRDSMLQNELLLRCELGKPMTRGYNQYPGEVFRYGRPNEVKDGGAADALRGWSGWGHSQRLMFPQGRTGGGDNQGKDGPVAERDFMALNRSAVQAGLTTAPQLYQFRASHDIRRSVKSEEGKKKNTRRLSPTMVFGIATRPSTPIHDLLENKYQDRWLVDRQSAELAKMQKDETQRMVPGKVYETRASMLRTYQMPVDPAPYWKLPRFSNSELSKAKPHLSTFRSEQAKNLSFKHHHSDCISRKGNIGHGVYEQAKN